MDKSQQQVRDFMKMAGQGVNNFPFTPSPEGRRLGVSLILEELLELAEASGVDILIGEHKISLIAAFKDKQIDFNSNGRNDFVEVADALADIKYVTNWTANKFGIDLEPVFDEIHASNMSKRWTGIDVRDHITAREGKAYYGDIEVTVKMLEDSGDLTGEENDRVLGVYDMKGKFIKSPTYRKANVRPIVESQRPQD